MFPVILAISVLAAITLLSMWLRRPGADRTGENLDLGAGSNLSGRPECPETRDAPGPEPATDANADES